MKQKEKGLIYEPVAGLTIIGAFLEAIKMAKEHGKPVHAIINDIEMNVTAKTNAVKAVATYQKKNKERYEAEIRAYEQRQTKRS